MKILPKSVQDVINAFEKLPSIGPKTAQRLAFYLLRVPQADLDTFSQSLAGLKKNTVLCSICKNVAEGDPCQICTNDHRDKRLLCVVEQSMDLVSLERTGKYNGTYHVLHGAIDPLNNIGPDEIFIADMLKRVTDPDSKIEEIVLATNPNMEGEATAMYIVKQLKDKGAAVKVTRLAHGLPVGADVEYADEVTLTRALEGRREF